MGYTGIGRRLTGVVATALSLLFVGVAAVPAHAEPARDMQWHLDVMQAEKMWEVSKGEGVTVAVLDTGVDASLRDLRGQVLKGKDFSGLPGDAHDDYAGHGTGMASLIAATGAAGSVRGTMGLAPEAKILPLRINDKKADNFAEGHEQFVASLAPAIRYAASSEAKIINISMASFSPSRKIQSAVKYALSKGKLIFAGTGNVGENADSDPLMYPAAAPGVVGVAAVDREGSVTEESVNGPQVDLAAPGKEIVYSCPGGSQLCMAHGTSDATALASASAALIWAEHPEWTANQVIRVLVETAGGPESGQERSDQIGYGIVRPRIALLEGPVDPGDPNTSPIPASPYYEGKASPSSKLSTGTDDSANADDHGQAATPVGDDADSGLSTTEWVLYGLVSVVAVAAIIIIPLVLSGHRRETLRAAAVPPYPLQSPEPPMAPSITWQDEPPQQR